MRTDKINPLEIIIKHNIYVCEFHENKILCFLFWSAIMGSMAPRREERSMDMINVIKRDGEKAEFSLNKITEAIKKAFKATGKEYNHEILELLSLGVTADFQSKMDGDTIGVDQIREGYQVTVRTADPGEEGEEVFTCKGASVLEALSNLSLSTGRPGPAGAL